MLYGSGIRDGKGHYDGCRGNETRIDTITHIYSVALSHSPSLSLSAYRRIVSRPFVRYPLFERRLYPLLRNFYSSPNDIRSVERKRARSRHDVNSPPLSDSGYDLTPGKFSATSRAPRFPRVTRFHTLRFADKLFSSLPLSLFLYLADRCEVDFCGCIASASPFGRALNPPPLRQSIGSLARAP